MVETGFIMPIEFGSILRPEGMVQKPGGKSDGIFKDIFSNAVADVNETQSNLEQQQYLLATGQIDDAHTVPIASSEAQISVDLLVQLRNKAVESYNELMRISV